MKPKNTSLEADDEADHIFVSYFNTTGKEATNSPSQNKNKNITPKGISAEIFVARFWRLCGGHTSRALILYRRVRHQTAMATLARCTHPTATKAACPCENGHVFPTWQLTCAGQPLQCESLPALILPSFPVLVPFRMGGTRSLQGEGWQRGQLPLFCPSAFLPAQGRWQRGQLRAPEQAAHRQGSPPGSLGTQGGPTMPVLAAEKGQINPSHSSCLRGRKRKGQRRWWSLRLEAAVCERRGWQGWRKKAVDSLLCLTPWLIAFNDL